MQVFNNGDDEKSTLLESIAYIQKFENLQISNSWFKTYYEGKLNQYKQNAKLSFTNIDIAMKHFYKEYIPGYDINDAAIKSIQVYKDAIKIGDEGVIDEYLAYNRNHALAYQD